MTNSTIDGNVAGGGGGGIYDFGSPMTIIGCTIADNSAASTSAYPSFGGGIDNADYNVSGAGTVNIVNSTIADNSASVGGGVFGFPEVVSSTVAYNRAYNLGGGGGLAPGAVIDNSIV